MSVGVLDLERKEVKTVEIMTYMGWVHFGQHHPCPHLMHGSLILMDPLLQLLCLLTELLVFAPQLKAHLTDQEDLQLIS